MNGDGSYEKLFWNMEFSENNFHKKEKIIQASNKPVDEFVVESLGKKLDNPKE